MLRVREFKLEDIFMKEKFNQQLKNLLKELVEIKSITGNEIETAVLLERFFKQHGIEGTIDKFAPKRANYIASCINNPNKKTLILCGHMDVVHEGDLKLWDSDPFVFTEKDGLWYARGVCDAKGSLAAMAVAFLKIISQKEFK